jgi:hypothetical protein
MQPTDLFIHLKCQLSNSNELISVEQQEKMLQDIQKNEFSKSEKKNL